MSPSLKSSIQYAGSLAINAAESPLVFNQNTSSNAYRSSEHDPLLIVLNFDLSGKPDPANTPKMKKADEVEIPADAPEKPADKVQKNKKFKISMNLAKLNEMADSPITLGDFASVIVSRKLQAQSASDTSSPKVELEASHFESGVVVLEVEPLQEGNYELHELILAPDGESQKYASDTPALFEVTSDASTTTTPASTSSSSGGSLGWLTLSLLAIVGRIRRRF